MVRGLDGQHPTSRRARGENDQAVDASHPRATELEATRQLSGLEDFTAAVSLPYTSITAPDRDAEYQIYASRITPGWTTQSRFLGSCNYEQSEKLVDQNAMDQAWN